MTPDMTDRERALVEAARPFAEWTAEAAKMVATIESVNGDVHPLIRRIADLGKPLQSALAQYQEPSQ